MKYFVSNVGIFLPDDREVITRYAKTLEEAFQIIQDFKWKEWSVDSIESGIAKSEAYCDENTIYIAKGGNLWDYLMQVSPQVLAEALTKVGDGQMEI